MTKYVLNSGGVKRHPDRKKRFHLEIVKGVGATPKFLLCNFAQGRENWERQFQGYCNAIVEDMPEGIESSFELAMPALFQKQCRAADIIYFHGGDDRLLQYWMRQFDLGKLFGGKIVATNSASSDMLAVHYWSSDWRECGDGLGVLPIKFIPHYLSNVDDIDPRGPINWQAAYSGLKEYGNTKLPIHALEEGEFIVVDQ